MNTTIQKNTIWLGLRFLVLPALLLPPFWLTRYTTATCLIAWLPDGSQLHPGEKTLATVGQATANPKYFGVILWTLLISFLVVSFLQIGSKKYRLRFSRAKQQFMVAAASVVVTTPIYLSMHHFSQYRFPPNWSCSSDGVLHGGLNTQAHFGLGLAPTIAVAITAIYLLAPLTALFVTRPKSTKLWLSK